MLKPEINAYLQAALNAERQGDYRSCISLLWISVRRSIFSRLDEKGIVYRSTESAVFEFIRQCPRRDIAQALVELYHVSIIVEFDDHDFSANPYVFRSVSAAKEVLSWLSGSIPKYTLAKEKLLLELDEHINDCRWSLTCHFYASDVFAKRQDYFVTYPLVVSTALTASLGLESLKGLTDYLGLGSSIIVPLTQVIAFGGLVLSLLNAAINWSLRSQRHRVAANKYIRVRRDAKQIKLEVLAVDGDLNLTAVILEKINSIKIELNNAAEEAPDIPDWAFRHAAREIGSENLNISKSSQVD
ncbi:SLATT domain-containing protein [Roseibium sediminis]|uniref:SLATT domain-containing protein n=1 Tax=Roseibium sediminis TaxID=1775174 RepID=UPI00123C90A6|nr:SLATT domain-containing protein [Roseibium sediminis]